MKAKALLIAILAVLGMQPASADENQILTVAQLATKCSTADPATAAFCLGLATGVLSQLQMAGNFYMAGRMSNEAREILQMTGAACGPIEPKLALLAFISWAKIHPEKQGWNGISGLSAAIQQSWPCKEHL